MTPDDVRRFRSKVRVTEGCWEWTGGRISVGYGMFWLDGRQQRAARVALAIDGRPIPDGMMALHHCDNRGCVRPSHLYIGTHADNMRDRNVRGRTARIGAPPQRGSAHHAAKVTEDDVRVIRAEYQPGLGGVLMRRYGITQAALWAIVNGRTWRHVL
jgi:hypothetical protein